MIYIQDGKSSQGHSVKMQPGHPYGWDIFSDAKPKPSASQINEMMDWCVENANRRGWLFHRRAFWFASHVDACAFKMRFG
ncbi:MAG: hypothetical protein EOP83_11520 [Verrucomicrobiaceae bacterium]|nr:MAG: hypothetical protein EOP83_11520 [Verrucomicrobiaceae bacterium]